MTNESEEGEHELRYTIYVTAYGHKRKCRASVGQALARALWLAFGKHKFRIVDHRSMPIKFDPSLHDFGLGEN